MDDHRDFAPFSGENDRNRDESSFGEDHVRLQVLDQDTCFVESFQHTKRICEVLYAEIAAQLSGRNTMIGDAEGLDEFLLDPIIRTYVVYVITKFPETREQCNVRSDMSGGTAAG